MSGACSGKVGTGFPKRTCAKPKVGCCPQKRNNGTQIMERTKPPFRADHVGSLIRPDALIKAREQAEKKAISDAELKRDPAGRDPRGRAHAGGPRAQGRHRRRIQPPLLAPGFHAEVRQRADGAVEADGEVSFRRRRPPAQPADHAGDGQAGAARGRRNFRRRLQVPGVDRTRDAEDHGAVADRDAFPRRTRGDRRQGLSRHRRLLRRPRAALPRGDRATSRRPAAAISRSTR